MVISRWEQNFHVHMPRECVEDHLKVQCSWVWMTIPMYRFIWRIMIVKRKGNFIHTNRSSACIYHIETMSMFQQVHLSVILLIALVCQRFFTSPCGTTLLMVFYGWRMMKRDNKDEVNLHRKYQNSDDWCKDRPLWSDLASLVMPGFAGLFCTSNASYGVISQWHCGQNQL